MGRMQFCSKILVSLLLYKCLQSTLVSGKLLFKNDFEENKQNMELIVKCLKEIVNKYASDRTLMLYSGHMNDSGLNVRLLLEPDLRITTKIHTMSFKNDPYKHIYIVQNPKTDLKVLNDFLKTVSKGSYIINMLELSGLTSTRWMEKVFKVFHDNSILNVLSLIEHPKGIIKIFTYFPYAEDNCGTGKAYALVDEYSAKGFKTHFDLFSGKERLRNLHGCSVNAFGSTQAPESFMIPAPNNSWKVKGNIVPYLETFQQRYNMTIKYYNLFNDTEDWFFTYCPPTEFRKKILNNNIQFGFGNFYFLDSILVRRFLHYSFTYNPECITFAVPEFSGEKAHIFTVFMVEFKYIVWLCILGVLFFSFAFVVFASKFERQHHTLFEIFLLIAVPYLANPGKWKSALVSVHIFLWVWSLWVLVVACSYGSALGSFMTLNCPPKNMKSHKEIVDRQFQIVGPRALYSMMQGVTGNEQEMKYFMDNFEVLPQGVTGKTFSKIHDDRNIAAFFPCRYSKYYSRMIADQRSLGGSRQAAIIIPDCFFSTSSTPFVTIRGSIIYNLMDEYSQQIFESGLNVHWRRKDEIPDPKPSNTLMPLGLRKVVGVFVIYLCGIGLSSLVFLLELLQGKLKKMKSVKATNQRNHRRGVL